MTEKQKTFADLAKEIYELDGRVFNATGSAVARVFGSDRDYTINHITTELEHGDTHIVRSEFALIGNMARTIPDDDVRASLTAEYEDLAGRLLESVDAMSDDMLLSDRADKNQLYLSKQAEGDSHLVICISRSYGSGGNTIGFKLAEKLNINYYDAEVFSAVDNLIEAEKDGQKPVELGGYAEQVLDKSEGSYGKGVYHTSAGPVETLKRFDRYHGLPYRDAMFFKQSDLLCRKAREEDFVVMGRCADVVMENNGIPRISIFLTAPEKFRVQRIMETDKLNFTAARKRMDEIDKKHASYYEYFTGLQWGNANHYDICLNTAHYGIQGAVDFIYNLLKGSELAK